MWTCDSPCRRAKLGNSPASMNLFISRGTSSLNSRRMTPGLATALWWLATPDRSSDGLGRDRRPRLQVRTQAQRRPFDEIERAQRRGERREEVPRKGPRPRRPRRHEGLLPEVQRIAQRSEVHDGPQVE